MSGHVGINVEGSEIANLEADITLRNGVLAASATTDPTFLTAHIIGTFERSQKALNVVKLESPWLMAETSRLLVELITLAHQLYI